MGENIKKTKLFVAERNKINTSDVKALDIQWSAPSSIWYIFPADTIVFVCLVLFINRFSGDDIHVQCLFDPNQIQWDNIYIL